MRRLSTMSDQPTGDTVSVMLAVPVLAVLALAINDI